MVMQTVVVNGGGQGSTGTFSNGGQGSPQQVIEEAYQEGGLSQEVDTVITITLKQRIYQHVIKLAAEVLVTPAPEYITSLAIIGGYVAPQPLAGAVIPGTPPGGGTGNGGPALGGNGGNGGGFVGPGGGGMF